MRKFRCPKCRDKLKIAFAGNDDQATHRKVRTGTRIKAVPEVQRKVGKNVAAVPAAPRNRWVTTKQPSAYRLSVQCRDLNRGPNRCYGYHADVLGRSRGEAIRRMQVNLDSNARRLKETP